MRGYGPSQLCLFLLPPESRPPPTTHASHPSPSNSSLHAWCSTKIITIRPTLHLVGGSQTRMSARTAAPPPIPSNTVGKTTQSPRGPSLCAARMPPHIRTKNHCNSVEDVKVVPSFCHTIPCRWTAGPSFMPGKCVPAPYPKRQLYCQFNVPVAGHIFVRLFLPILMPSDVPYSTAARPSLLPAKQIPTYR